MVVVLKKKNKHVKINQTTAFFIINGINDLILILYRLIYLGAKYTILYQKYADNPDKPNQVTT